MLSKTLITLLTLSASSLAAPVALTRREVPQEHSHEKFLRLVKTSLNLNNPDGIVDPVFGLLGNAAAAAGLGKISDPDCLQQATADQAFTNAKAAGDVVGQVAALTFRTLERNTGRVGLASVACTAIKAVNPEIAALKQHQDPASDNAAAVNKEITLELARQIAAVGGDPQEALLSGTFAPGQLNDNTGAGNTCDDANDAVGCIFTLNRLVEDATAAEIDAAVAGAGNGGGNNGGNNGGNDNGATPECPEVVVTVTVTPGAAATATTTTAAAPPAATTVAPAAPAAGANLQTFTKALGGVVAPSVFATADGKFQVTGNAAINDAQNAVVRSCDVQNNQCANASNGNRNAGFSVGDCNAQQAECIALARA